MKVTVAQLVKFVSDFNLRFIAVFTIARLLSLY